MASDAASEPLPPLYARWVTQLLGGGLIPREAQSTCNHCAMQPACGEKPKADGYYFDPVIKCCTYLPQLYNFLVGAILSDPDPAAQPGRASVEKRMAEGISVTPLGLAQTAVFSLLHDSGSEVARAFHGSPSTVNRWVRHAHGRRLDIASPPARPGSASTSAAR